MSKKNIKIKIGSLLVGIILFFTKSEFAVTGKFLRGFNEINFFQMLGITIIFVSMILMLKKDSLEAVVVPTGPSLEIDQKRAKNGARKYLQNKDRFVIISGIYNDGKLHGSQSEKIYRTLREGGVPRERILFEHESEDTLENVLYTSKLAMEKGIKNLIVSTDKPHAKRFKLLFDRAKKKGLAPKDLRVRYTTRGLEPSYNPAKAKVAYKKDSVRPMRKV